MDESTPSIQPINRTKVPIAVAAQLQRLLGEEYQPGDKLPPEKVLSEGFGVGRSSIREALRLLEAEGRVRIVHGVGTIVGEAPMASVGEDSRALLVLDQSTVPELFEARRALESETAGRAAERVTSSEAEELRELLERLHDDTLSDESYVEVDVALHLSIARVTKNRVLIHLLDSLKSQLIEYSRRVIQLPGRREKANEGHRSMIEAILAQDPSAASEALIKHVGMVENEIALQLENKDEDVKGKEEEDVEKEDSKGEDSG